MSRQQTTVEAPAETCPQCGGPRSDFSCRPVPLGFWCRQYGLKEDPHRILQPAPDPLKEAVEQDRDVRRAAAELDRRTAEYDRLTSQWEAAALAAYRARQRRATEGRDVVVDGMIRKHYPPGTPTDGALKQLEENQTELDRDRRQAFKPVIAARTQLEATKNRARRRLGRQAS
jgi:hypothetical protein